MIAKRHRLIKTVFVLALIFSLVFMGGTAKALAAPTSANSRVLIKIYVNISAPCLSAPQATLCTNKWVQPSNEYPLEYHIEQSKKSAENYAKKYNAVGTIQPGILEDEREEMEGNDVLMVYTVSSELQLQDHLWSSGTITKQPTQTEAGIREFFCELCGGTREEEIPKLGQDDPESTIVAVPEYKGHIYCDGMIHYLDEFYDLSGLPEGSSISYYVDDEIRYIDVPDQLDRLEFRLPVEFGFDLELPQGYVFEDSIDYTMSGYVRVLENTNIAKPKYEEDIVADGKPHSISEFYDLDYLPAGTAVRVNGDDGDCFSLSDFKNLGFEDPAYEKFTLCLPEGCSFSDGSTEYTCYYRILTPIAKPVYKGDIAADGKVHHINEFYDLSAIPEDINEMYLSCAEFKDKVFKSLDELQNFEFVGAGEYILELFLPEGYGFEDNTEYPNLQDIIALPIRLVEDTQHETHHGVLVPGTPAGCETPGVKDYYECSDCHRYFEDATCLVEIADVDTWKVIPAGHKDAGNDGECDACGKILEYRIIEGANQSFTKGSAEDVVIRCNGKFENFTGLKVDGADLAGSNYTAVSGSTIVTLNKNYTDTLSVGDHKVEFVYNDGSAETVLTVKDAAQAESTKPADGGKTAPKTGDSNNAAIWLVLLMISAVCIITGGAVVRSRRRR